jgi:hypothetical protein
MTDDQADDQADAAAPDVFDIANWLERAGAAGETPPVAPDYVPRHRADVGVDSVA